MGVFRYIVQTLVTHKGSFVAVVRDNKQIGQRHYRLGLEFEADAAEAFAGTEPGQFAQLDLAAAPAGGYCCEGPLVLRMLSAKAVKLSSIFFMVLLGLLLCE